MAKTPEKKVLNIGKAELRDLGGGKIEFRLAGHSTTFEYKELWGVTFVLGRGKYRDEMLPAQKKEMMVFSRKHVVEITKDVKAGERLNFWCEVDIPKIIVESIAEENGAKVIYQAEDVVPTSESSSAETKAEEGVQ